MKTAFGFFVGAEKGATSIEYALISSFIALVIITAGSAVGKGLSDVFVSVAAGF